MMEPAVLHQGVNSVARSTMAVLDNKLKGALYVSAVQDMVIVLRQCWEHGDALGEWLASRPL
jgi:hypothetical protein